MMTEDRKYWKPIVIQLLLARKKFIICNKIIEYGKNDGKNIFHEFWVLSVNSMVKDCFQTLANIFYDNRSDVLSNYFNSENKKISGDYIKSWIEFVGRHQEILEIIYKHRQKILSHFDLDIFSGKNSIDRLSISDDRLKNLFEDLFLFFKEFEPDVYYVILSEDVSGIDSVINDMKFAHDIKEIKMGEWKKNPFHSTVVATIKFGQNGHVENIS